MAFDGLAEQEFNRWTRYTIEAGKIAVRLAMYAAKEASEAHKRIVSAASPQKAAEKEVEASYSELNKEFLNARAINAIDDNQLAETRKAIERMRNFSDPKDAATKAGAMNAMKDHIKELEKDFEHNFDPHVFKDAPNDIKQMAKWPNLLSKDLEKTWEKGMSSKDISDNFLSKAKDTIRKAPIHNFVNRATNAIKEGILRQEEAGERQLPNFRK